MPLRRTQHHRTTRRQAGSVIQQWRETVDVRKNRLGIALGSIAAGLVLLAAFMVVWLMPRGPEPGGAAGTPGGTGGTTVNSGTSVGSNFDSEKVMAPQGGVAGQAAGASTVESPRISVRGTGIVSAKPDMATVQIGVQIQNASLDAAQAEAADKSNALLDQIKAAGVEEKDIATSQFSVEPVMDYRDGQAPRVTGFRVTHMFTVKIRDLGKAGQIIDDLVASGANTVYGLSFGFSNPDALMNQAREQAVKNARATAEQLATLGSVQLGGVILIEDGGSNTAPMPVAMPAADMRQGAGGAAPMIQAGQQEVLVQVNVVYAIK
jgi:uncharacterized protein YggE